MTSTGFTWADFYLICFAVGFCFSFFSFIFGSSRFGRLHLPRAALAHLVLIPNPPHHPRGDFGLEGDRVVNRESERLTYSGVGVYRPEFFAGCTAGRFTLLPLLNRAIAASRVRGELHRGEWSDVGTAERLAALSARLAALE